MTTTTWAHQTALYLMEAHGLTNMGWRFQFDNGRNRFGVCKYDCKVISLSRYLVGLNSETEVRQVILHEIAHALVGPGHGHGPTWKTMARRIGADPRRTHSAQTVPGRYHVQCGRCNTTIGTRHRKGSGTYTHKGCGGIVHFIDTGVRYA